MSNSENKETKTISFFQYSMWTIFKILICCFIITWLCNTFAYGTVGMNHVLAKMIGIAADAGNAVCDFCFDAINR